MDQFVVKVEVDTTKDFDQIEKVENNAPNDSVTPEDDTMNCTDFNIQQQMDSADDDDDFFDECKLETELIVGDSFDGYYDVFSADEITVGSQQEVDECFSDDGVAESSVVNVPNENAKSSPKKYDCHMCGRSYLSENHLKIHFLTHQDRPEDMRPTEK